MNTYTLTVPQLAALFGHMTSEPSGDTSIIQVQFPPDPEHDWHINVTLRDENRLAIGEDVSIGEDGTIGKPIYPYPSGEDGYWLDGTNSFGDGERYPADGVIINDEDPLEGSYLRDARELVRHHFESEGWKAARIMRSSDNGETTTLMEIMYANGPTVVFTPED